jgi:hypothetical protein
MTPSKIYFVVYFDIVVNNTIMDKQKLVLIVMVVLVTAGGTLYGLIQRNENVRLQKQIAQLKNDPQSINRDEIQLLTDKMSKLIALPEGETPILFPFDKEKYKDQPIFSKTDNGDKILIYTNAKKAYIYRPSKNVIVDVIPVNVGDTTTPSIAGTSVDKPIKLAIYNGTKIANLAATLEQRIIDQKVVGVSVVSKVTAVKSDYKKTIVIDLTGKLSKQTASLATLLEADVATDAAEIKPAGADLMVIVGENFK